MFTTFLFFFGLFQDSSDHLDCRHVRFQIEYDFDTPLSTDAPIYTTPQNYELLSPLSDFSSLEEIPDYDNVAPWWADLPADNDAQKLGGSLEIEHQVAQITAEKQQKLEQEISEKRVNKLKDIITSVSRKRAKKHEEDDTSSDDSSSTSTTSGSTATSSGSDSSKSSVYMTVYYKPSDVKVMYGNTQGKREHFSEAPFTMNVGILSGVHHLHI